MAIDRKTGAGDGAGAERIAVRRCERGLKTNRVPLQLLDDREQVMSDGGDLRRLGVRMGGKNSIPVLRGKIDQ